MRIRACRAAAFLLALLLMLAWAVSAGADEQDGYSAADELDTVIDFDDARRATWETIGAKRGAKLPVYSAPFADALRAAGGKAALGTGEAFSLLGTLQGGTWAMVEYRLDSGHRRIGWIELPAGAPQRRRHEDFQLNRRSGSILTQTAELTDDPRTSRSALTVLTGGQGIIAMAVCRTEKTDWLYVEAQVEGKPCWGFVPAEAVRLDPDSDLYRLENGRLIIREGVSGMGFAGSFYESQDGGSNSDTMVRAGDIDLPNLWLYSSQRIREVVFPDSLRRLGGEAFVEGLFDTLRLDGRLETVSPWCFYGIRVETLVLAADYVLDVPVGEYVMVGQWRVEPGNPRYSDRDGVLYTADGKTLLKYPNGRKAEHYDVPAGTEAIGKNAFGDDNIDLPLKTVSLPIGLKRIGADAFSGCGRLMSLTVPLTVTELDPTAFDCCVSLERLSLPPGLTAEFNTGWAEQGDFTYFNGDNGSTLPRRKPPEEWEDPDLYTSFSGILDTPSGEGEVTAYADSTGDTVSAAFPVGEKVWVYRIRDGRGLVTYPWDEEEAPAWIPLRCIRPDVEETLFSVLTAEPADPGMWDSGETPLVYDFLQADGAVFSRGSFPDTEEVTLPYAQVRLYRKGPEDGRGMGLIVSGKTTVSLCDKPGGEAVGHLFPLTQALVLTEENGWLQVQTAEMTGWLPAAYFVRVEPLPDGSD